MYYTVFDIETTGLDASICDIIQFAYANLDENFNCIKAECLYFYRDDMHWSEEAFKIHGISKDFLRKYKDDYETNLKKMYITLARSNAVTFNGDNFDIPFCNTWLKKQGMLDINPNRTYDVMRIYQPVFKKRIKLVALPEKIGLQKELIEAVAKSWFGYSGGAHDASYDVTATALGFSYAIRNGYAHDDSKETISLEEQRILESSLWEKSYFEESDFSSLVCYMIENNTGRYIVNLCSDKEKYVSLKIPIQSYNDVIYSDKYKDKDLPIPLVNNIINAYESGVVFKGDNDTYTAEIAPGIVAQVVNTSRECKFVIPPKGV